MESKAALLIKVLLNHFHPAGGASSTAGGASGSAGGQEAFLKLINEETAARVREETAVTDDFAALIPPPKDVLSRIHYSWLVSVIETFPTALQGLIAESLLENQTKPVASILRLQEPPELGSAIAKQYLLNALIEQLSLFEIEPPSFLPKTLMTPLLSMTKKELVELIDYLGLYDLADEVRRIVDKRNLKVIFASLTTKKQHFLRQCLHSREKISSPSLEIEKLQGASKAALLNLLHKRGLARLSKALSGSGPNFCWHIIHRLDTGRGLLLQKMISPEEVPGVTQVMKQEVLNVIEFLNKFRTQPKAA